MKSWKSELWNWQDIKKIKYLLEVDSKIVCLKRQWLLCIQFYSLNCVKSAILEIKGVDNIHWGLKAETLFCWFENVIGLKRGRMSGSWYCFHATKKYSIRLSDSWSRMTGIPNGKRLRYYHYNKGPKYPFEQRENKTKFNLVIVSVSDKTVFLSESAGPSHPVCCQSWCKFPIWPLIGGFQQHGLLIGWEFVCCQSFCNFLSETNLARGWLELNLWHGQSWVYGFYCQTIHWYDSLSCKAC